MNVPANAVLSYSGDICDCDRGYRKEGAGCAAIAVPANVRLSPSGKGWDCIDGHLKRGSACVPASQATDAEIRQALINASIAAYPGNCPCPYFADRAGRSCGRRSAWSRAGGYSPLCYPNDVNPEQIRNYRNSHSSAKP